MTLVTGRENERDRALSRQRTKVSKLFGMLDDFEFWFDIATPGKREG